MVAGTSTARSPIREPASARRASVASVPSFHEFLIIVFVIALIFGAPRLPQIGDALGRSIRNFKRGVKGENEIDVTPSVEHKQVDPPKENGKRA
jgi:sec-independent protein translocase protein TatA